MSEALNELDFIEAQRIFIPPEPEKIVERFFVQSEAGALYSLTSIIGSDLEVGEEIFIIRREICSENNLPADGVWWDIDPQRTKLRTEFRYRRAEAYVNFQEFHDVQFWSGNKAIIICRKPDRFGIEKLLIVVRDESAEDCTGCR